MPKTTLVRRLDEVAAARNLRLCCSEFSLYLGNAVNSCTSQIRHVSGVDPQPPNCLLAKLKDHFEVRYDYTCMHEFVLSASRQKAHGVRALDIAKALIDKGFHPPSMYFPLVVDEALMVEPTETECKETLDAFVAAMIDLAREAETDPEALHEAPQTTPVRRLDEVGAARNLRLCCT